MESKHFRMVIFIKETIELVNHMVEENTLGKIKSYIKVNSFKDIDMARES